MKNTSVSLRLLPVAAVLCAAVLSCQKSYNPSVPPQGEQQVALMNATNAVFNASKTESQDIGDVVLDTEDSVEECRKVTYKPSKSVYPHEKIIDYGTGCEGADNIRRSGKKMVMVYTDPNTAAAGVLVTETTFDNYYIDGVKITGMVKAYIESPATSGQRVVKVVATKGLSSGAGDLQAYTSTTYVTQTEGASTPSRMDNVFRITGGAQGYQLTHSDTLFNWTSAIDALNPAIKPAGCGNRTQGVVNININLLTDTTSFTEILDYGSGTCDNTATLSINGGTPKEVRLPLLFWPLY